MKLSGKILLLTVAVAGLTIGKVSAQQAHVNGKLPLNDTSVALSNGNSNSVAQGSKDAPPPPSEKKKWAIQVTQGEKWYQLSVKLVM